MPNVTTKPVSVTMEPQLHAQLEARARDENRSVSKHIVHLVKEDLKSAGIALKPLDASLKKLLKRGGGGRGHDVSVRPETDYVTGKLHRRKNPKPHDQ